MQRSALRAPYHLQDPYRELCFLERFRMPSVIQSKARENVAHTLPATPETPRSAFEGVSLHGESKGSLQRTLSAHARKHPGPSNDGTCPAPDRHSSQPTQNHDRHVESDGTCPAPEHFKRPDPSLMQRVGNAIRDGLSRIGLGRRELPCE